MTPVDYCCSRVVPGKTAESLEVIASRTDTELPYYRVSSFLAATVLREGEAVLARNIMGDSSVSSRDSKGEIHATSVICAPIRRGRTIFGLIHLYSTNASRSPDPDDLEFTLAVADTVAVALQNLHRRQELAENLNQTRDENTQLRERLGAQSEIVGNSPAITRIIEEIARAAPVERHRADPRRKRRGQGTGRAGRAFLQPAAKGAVRLRQLCGPGREHSGKRIVRPRARRFTGAVEKKIGKFEASHKGTLMLDEIGEMSPTIQAKLLRVLEGHPFERVGGSESLKVDVRVIAATNRDLEKDVTEGRFRRDLYFRLHVLEIVVPALRKRPEDIPLLADYFFQRFNRRDRPQNARLHAATPWTRCSATAGRATCAR